ncbi:unnamed protein product [Cylindrotheca closterium]|uniref:PIPK domain-containing protein n=1 Tax=Cylindrotheca closterium TaxID=2856 RepID=A0AAD2C9W4_9STRA|nr:unnamed protein product [Cylindrotheca closterium]
MWLDLALKGIGLASTIIATLRAGSRLAFLAEHDAIGILEGPTITRPSINESDKENESGASLFEISEAFRHCVRLSFAPHYYHNVQFQQPVSAVVEPYPLSGRHHPDIQQGYDEADGIEKKETIQERTEVIAAMLEGANSTLNQTLSDMNDAALLEYDETTSNEKAPIESTIYSFSRRLAFAANPLNGARVIASWIPPAIQQSQQYLVATPKLASFYAKKALHKAPSDDEKDNLMSEWDHGSSTEAEIEYQTSFGKENVAELSVFCPEAFANLRSTFGISEDSYRNSIFGSGPFVSFQSNSKGAARVGGVFFFTRDGAYMIKTIKTEEAKTFLEMLPKYHHHMKRFARTSLLTRFCGMYGVRIHEKGSLDRGQLHTFVVMNAVFPAEASNFVSERYDLKGSTVGREVSEEELERKGRDAVLKDLDLAREVDLVRSLQTESNSGEYGFTIGATAKAALLSQLREDVRLLVDCGVMDYSLLVGVVNMAGKHKQAKYTTEALLAMQKQGIQLDRLEAPPPSKRLDKQALSFLGTPLRLLLAPPTSVVRQAWYMTQNTLSSVITLPLPYYGSGNCVVDGGSYAIMHGKRRGERALYYMGLIDFLQPWTTRKRIERKLKGLAGYDTAAVSCVDPEAYAERFLEFLDANIS